MSQSDADDEEVSEVESIVFDPEDMDKHTIFASKLALLAATGQTSSLEALDGDSSLDECLPVDAETQARLEALLEAAGIGKLSTSDGKAFAEPEVLRRLTSSVSCALDEAAAALSRMRAETATQQERSLAEACSDGDINLVKRLLEEGRSVHETTEDGESLLSLACSAGYYELAEVLLSVPPLCHESVYLHSESAKTLRNKMNSDFLQILNYQLTKVLLAMHANAEDRGSKGECTPLMEAASGGYKDIVHLLLRHKADVNAKSSTGNTALAFACCGGYVDIVKILIDAGAELEVHNENGHTPLMEAASGGHVEVAMLLLQHGVGINTHSNEFKESALTLACYKGHLEMVRFLLEAGADQEHKTDEMHTALMEASMDGHVDVARLLLDSGAQVNMPADSFESPLTLAACGGHVELASLLLERGASLEEVNDEGYTPLMEAAREGHEEMVAVLLAHGANVNAQTEETQETALTLACCGGFLDCAELLVNFSADLELGCSTPLMEAAQEGHLELVKYLIRAGADVNHATSSGETALTVACEHGHTDIADELLKDGANLEQEAEGGRTPLMKAARAGQYCMVQYLISQGANVNRTTRNNDHSVLSLACVYGHLPVVELLLHYGADSTHILKDGSTMLLEAAKGGHSVVVQCLLDYAQNLYNTSNQSAAEASAQPPPTNQDESASRVPTQSLPMIVPPQEPDKSPCVHQSAASQHPPNIRNAADIITGTDKFPTAINNQFQIVPEPSIQQELATSDQNNLRNARAYAGSVKPIPPPPVSLQNSYANDSRTVATIANGAAAAATPQQQQTTLDATDSLLPLLSVDKEVRVHVESFLRTMTSGSTGLPKRTTESIVEHAQEKLTELEQRIKEAIENNAQSPELLQTEQLTKEKVEEMYKTREEQIQKKQKILEELQKVERDLQMKTHQQLKKHYMEVKAGKEQPLVADTTTEPELLPPAATQIPLRRGKPDGEDSPRFPAKQIPQPIPSVSPPPSDIPTTSSTTTAPVPTTQPANQEKRAPPAPVPPTCKHGPPINFPPEAIPPHLKEQLIRKRRNTFNADDSSEDGDSYPPHQHVHHHECNHHPCTTPHLTHPSTPSPHPFRGDSPAYNAEDTGGEFHQSSEMRNAFPALNINCFTESNHDTPLSLACAGGYDDLVQLLISRGAQVEHRDKKGFTPLILAATAGHTGVVQILLDANADIESQSERTKDTPLSLSCSGGREDVVRLLLERGANKEHRNVSDYTPLSLAASGGYVNIIKLLLNYNAEINSRTGSKLGISPLMLAAMNGHTTAVQLLLDMGADINAQIETNRNTALTLACFQGRHEVVEILVNRRANVEHRAKTGLTPLMEAASGGYAEVGKVLLEKGADVNAPPVPSSRDTALTIAADKGHYRFCELVLSIWAAVDARNKKGNTPLWLACNGGHLDVAQLLVEHNADVNAADNRSITPLMAAFRKGHYKVVRWLVDEVSQFPSDEECMRYLTSIAHDRELFHRGRQCMEYIAAARERQAQEANKYASELLHEIDMEKSREETRRVRAARKRNRRRLKKKQKSNQDSKKDDQDEDQVETTEETEKEDKTPEKANKEVEKKQNEENKKMKDVAEATIKKSDKAKDNKMNVLKSAENILKTEKNQETKASKKKEVKPPTATVEHQSKTDANSKSKTPKEQPTPKVVSKPKSPPPIVETKKVEVSTEASKPPKSSITLPEPVEAVSRNTAAVAPTSQKKIAAVSRRSSAKSHARDATSASSKSRSSASSKTTPAPSPGKRSQRRSTEEGWKEVTRSNFSVKSKCVMVSSGSISRVIGRGGCNINAIREVTGAHIDIDKQRKGGHERTVTIKGSVKSIKMASQLINELTKPDITDEEVTTIIANARSEAAANAVSAAATLAATSTSTSTATSTHSSSMPRPVAVVEAPLPTRPAWTKPPSIITNQPQRANSGVALTQSSVWPNPTSLPPSRFPESEEKVIPTPQEPLVIASVPPSVETVKKALFTPSATNSTVSNSGKVSNSSSACSTPVPHATSISPPAVKQVQKPTTFASVSPHIVPPASEVDTKPVATAAIVTPTSVQAHPAPVTFPPKSSDKAISRPVQPVAPMPAKPQQQFMTNTNMPVAHSMPPRQMMPPSPASEHMMQYTMQRQQAEHPNNFHPNNPTTLSQQQRNIPHGPNQNTGMSVDGKPAFDSRMGVPEMMQSAGQGGYSHYSAFGMKPSSPWNAENKNSLPSPGGVNMSKPQPNNVIAPHTNVDQTKAPGYRVNLRSPINPEPPLTPGSGDQQQTPSPKSTKSPHASSQDSPDPKQHQTATSTPSSDRKIWPPPIGTERASSMNHRRNTGSGMLHPNHGNAVEASNIWSSSVKADTWASLSVNQDVADENQKREQQTPEAVNEEKASANQLEAQENLLTGRIPMYPNSQDALMQQASSAQAVISAQSNTSTSSLINPGMMSHAGIGTQPPIGSHLGTQAASHRQNMFLQQQQQPIGAHLGNSMRGSIPMPQQQHQQRSFNPVIRGSQPSMPAMQQHAFNSQFQNELNSPLLNSQQWQQQQQRSKPANTFPQQIQPQHAKFTASEAIFKDNMGMQTNDNSMQSQEYYMRMTGNNFNQQPIGNPAGMFHEKIGVIGGGYGSGMMNSAPGAQLQNSQMPKRSFPLQSQFDGMNNTAAYPPQYKQEMYSNPGEMQDVGYTTPGQQNMMPNPALWDNNMYHQQHQMHNNYDQFNSSSMGINGLENDMARGSQGVVGHQINGNNSWGW